MPRPVMVTGHRPDKLGGYRITPNSLGAQYRELWHPKLRDVLIELNIDGDVLGVSGMAQGIDQAYASLCIDLNIPFLAAVPFVGQESIWPPVAQQRYQTLLAKASEVVYVKDWRPPQNANFARLLHERNQWMVDYCKERNGHAIVVWDGTRGGTKDCLDRIRAAQLEHTIIRLPEYAKLYSILLETNESREKHDMAPMTPEELMSRFMQ